MPIRALPRRLSRLALALCLPLVATSALAVSPVNKSLHGTAVRGTDVVAYFAQGRPVAGSREHSFEWQGATWRFSSQEHRELFAADPERYAPQYGGYCAYAVAHGTTANIDPEAWKIVDGKLYLNLSPDVQARWERDIPGFVARADAHWPKLLAD